MQRKETNMDDRHARQHEQAVNFWREVAREARTDERVARQHIREELREEDAERVAEASIRRRGRTL
jgi:hypothetical protein